MLGHTSHHKSIKNKQKQLLNAILLMFFVCLSLFVASPVSAEDLTKTAQNTAKPTQEAAAKPPTREDTPIINTQIIAEIDSSIIVKLDGETLESTEVHRAENGGLYVNAMPIFQNLGNDVEFDAETKALIVRRSQDGVVMELYTDTGIVKADGRALGRLKHFGEVSEGRYILTPNAIAVLSGAAGRFKEKTNTFDFKLDPRLKVATGFDIFVNDVALGQLNPAPKSVGPVLLLPLLPIAEELGHQVQIIEDGSVVRVQRAQDSAVLTLNLETGLIKVRDNPIGLSKDIAYIDPVNLLLPVSAIEALTGTNVNAQGGTQRIDINLDERLSGAIAPHASVDDAAKNTPFTPESLNFTVGPDSLNTVEFKAHGGRLNTRTRYEIPDLPSNAAELEPAWLSVDFAHTKGLKGSVGDYAANFRELDGVGLRRIRGAAVHKVTKKGRWALAAGAPMQGARAISGDQSRPTYGGVAVGARFADREGWEAGLAYRKDSLTNDQMAVLDAISGRLGRVKDNKFQWDSQASLGYFNGDARENAVDVRALGRARYDVSKTITADASLIYDGAEFLRTDLTEEERQDDILAITDPDAVVDEDETIPDTRSAGLDQLNTNLNIRFTPQSSAEDSNGIFNNAAVALRVGQTKTGVLKHKSIGNTITTAGVSAASTLGDSGVSVTVDANYYDLKYANGAPGERGRQFSASAYKKFEDFTVRTRYRNEKRSGQEARQALSGSVSIRNFNVPLPKDARLSIAPSISALWNGEDISARGGVYANLDSGQVFGKKTKVSASLGVLQSLSSERQGQTNKFLTLAVARRVRLGKNMDVGLAYRNDLRGNHRIGLQLNGRFEFNETRKYKETEDGRGVLKGRAFFDKNRDGIKQDDEPPMPRTLVRLKSTRMALRTDNAGYFTIQNIKEGIYDVLIDAQSLPLGFDLSEDISTRVTIADGQITDVPLPIVQRGQIRGFAFVDGNKNGEYDRGETRLEGVKLKLSEIDGDTEEVVYSSSFGQYAFDDLPAAEYRVEVVAQKKARITGGKGFTLDLREADNMMGRRNVIVFKEEIDVMLAQAGQDPPLDTSVSPDTIGPAPP